MQKNWKTILGLILIVTQVINLVAAAGGISTAGYPIGVQASAAVALLALGGWLFYVGNKKPAPNRSPA